MDVGYEVVFNKNYISNDIKINFWRILIMAHVITDDCISCGACVSDCPVDCIKEGGDKYTIVKEDCIDCGACVPSCPVDAIKPE